MKNQFSAIKNTKIHRCSCTEDVETAAEARKRADFSAGTYLRYVEHETGEADTAYVAVLAAECRTTAGFK